MSCVLPSAIKALKEDVRKNGGAKFLRDMSSQERIDYLAKFTDTQPGKVIENRENAEILNRQIERKMLEPAQTAAINEWLRNLSKDKRIDTVSRTQGILDLMKNRQQILNPKKDKFFMGALVKQTLGFEASFEDIKKLSDLSATVEEYRKQLYNLVPNYENMSADTARAEAWSTEDGRKVWFAMGESLLKFKEQYDLMNIKSQTGIGETVKERATERIKDIYKEFKEGDATVALQKTGQAVKDTLYKGAGTLKASVGSLDISATFRQLWGLWVTNPKLAAKASWSGIKAFGREFINGDGKKLAMMDLMMRPNALNGNYERFGLEIGIAEEAYPENLFDKMGKLGRPWTSSDAAYSTATQFGRAEYFDLMLENTRDPKTKQPNLELLKKQDVGKVASQITGRGNLSDYIKPKMEKFLNLSLFSPRFFMSRVHMVTDLIYLRHINKNTPYGTLARAAVNNTVFTMVMTALFAAGRSWLRDKDDETPEEIWAKVFDPRSAQFLTGKVGETRIDLSSGVAPFLRTIARSVSGTTVTGEGQEKQQAASSTVFRFLGGKISPSMRLAQDAMKLAFVKDPVDYNYNPITLGTLAKEVIPISAENVITAAKSGDWSAWVGVGADVVGFSSQYWEPSQKNAGKSAQLVREQERLSFKTDKPVRALTPTKNSSLNTKLTGARRDRAVREFEQRLSTDLDRLIKSPAYKRMSDNDKQKAMAKTREAVNKDIKKKYGIK